MVYGRSVVSCHPESIRQCYITIEEAALEFQFINSTEYNVNTIKLWRWSMYVLVPCMVTQMKDIIYILSNCVCA